jgi:hypothetical protein
MSADELVNKLQRRLARDAKKKEHERIVYMYYRDGQLCDNLLLLHSETSSIHKQCFENWFNSFSDEDKNRFGNIEVKKVGVFYKDSLSFKSCTPKLIFKGSKI